MLHKDDLVHSGKNHQRSKGDRMKLSKNVFIMIVVLMLVLYSVANVVLFRMSGEHYVNTDLFFLITSIFAFVFVVCLPRIVEILLGFESRATNHEIYDKEMSDPECDSLR
jgi:hypothetical protein